MRGQFDIMRTAFSSNEFTCAKRRDLVRVTVNGELLKVDGVLLGICKSGCAWGATHIASGMLLCPAQRTRKELLEILPTYTALLRDPKHGQGILKQIKAFRAMTPIACEFDGKPHKENRSYKKKRAPRKSSPAQELEKPQEPQEQPTPVEVAPQPVQEVAPVRVVRVFRHFVDEYRNPPRSVIARDSYTSKYAA